LIEQSIDCSEGLHALPLSPDIHCNVYTDHATSLSDIKEYLAHVYGRISQELIKLIFESSIFDEEKVKKKKQFEEFKVSLLAPPEKTIIVYEAQYLKLADQFNDFSYFAQLQNFNGIEYAVNQNGTALQKLSDTANRIDVGLSNLNSIVNHLPQTREQFKRKTLLMI
jgi:hypothetical protein